MTQAALAGRAIEQAEIRLRTSGAVWRACAESADDSVLRLRLQPDALGVLPVLPLGTVVDCCLSSDVGRFFAEGTVTRLDGPVVWLSVARARLSTERRRVGRTAGGFPVIFVCDGVCATGACADIGLGGMRVRLPVPVSVGADLALTFRLPDAPADITVRGTVVHRDDDIPGEGCYVGIQFTDVPQPARARIAAHCGSAPAD